MDVDELDELCDDGLKAAQWLKRLGKIVAGGILLILILHWVF